MIGVKKCVTSILMRNTNVDELLEDKYLHNKNVKNATKKWLKIQN